LYSSCHPYHERVAEFDALVSQVTCVVMCLVNLNKCPTQKIARDYIEEYIEEYIQEYIEDREEASFYFLYYFLLVSIVVYKQVGSVGFRWVYITSRRFCDNCDFIYFIY
jgi:hypothetical protein